MAMNKDNQGGFNQGNKQGGFQQGGQGQGQGQGQNKTGFDKNKQGGTTNK